MKELKYREAILEIFSQLHSQWMDDEDKKMFNETMLFLYGEELNHSFEEGVKKGFSVERQIKSTIDYLSNDPNAFGCSAKTHSWYYEKYEKPKSHDTDPILYRDFSDIREALKRV